MKPRRILEAAESLRALDPATTAVARGLRKVVGHGAADRVLRGAWLGHPVHPLLVTLPIGAWSSAAVLDLTGQPATARRLVTIGLAATPPTVLTGLAEFSGLDAEQRRVGAIHALSNTVAAGCFLAANRSGRTAAARMWGLGGLLALTAGGALGGHLSYAQGAGVRRWSSLHAVGE